MSTAARPTVGSRPPVARARAEEGVSEALATCRSERDFWTRRLLAIADITGVGLALGAAALFAPVAHRGDLLLGFAVLPVWLILFKAYGLYDRDAKRVSHTTVDDLPWVFHAVLVGALLMWLFFKLVAGHKLFFAEMLAFGLVAIAATLLLRSVVRNAAVNGLEAERVLLLTGEAMTEVLTRKMRAHPEYGLDPIGVVAPPAGEAAGSELPALGRIDDLPEIVARHRIERLVVSPTTLSAEDQIRLLRQSRELLLKVSLLPQAFDAMGPSVAVDDVEGITLLGMNPPALSPSSRMLKRSLDLVGAALLLVFLSPLLLLIALAIKLDSRGPVFFKQNRIGKDGRRFRVWKFRTMVPNAERLVDELRAQSQDPHWLHLEHDPRITRVGRLLRLSSLDELPQLINVVRGEMSLVGPRPLIEDEDRRVGGWARSRLDLTPGITGSWQVLGRTKIPFEEMVKLDYLYVTNWSLWNDVRLMLRTLPVVLKRSGAN